MTEGDGKKERLEGEEEEGVRREGEGKEEVSVECSEGNDINFTSHGT